MSRAIHKMRSGVRIIIVGEVLGNVSSTPGLTHSLGNIDVGPSDSDKNIILGLTYSDEVSGGDVTSFTVGGVSLSEKVIATLTAGTDIIAAIYTADISSLSGSQAISVTFNVGPDSAGVSGVVVQRLRSLTPTMSVTDTDSFSGLLTMTGLAAQPGGIAFAVGSAVDLNNIPTWGTITQRSDLKTGASGADEHRHTAAWDLGGRSAANATLDFAESALSVVVSAAGFR